MQHILWPTIKKDERKQGLGHLIIRNILNSRIYLAHFVLWIALVVYVVRLLIPMLDYGSPFGISLPSTEQKSSHAGLKIVDFPFHFNFAQKVWKKETTVSSGESIYSVENHLKVASDWAGQKMGSSLHFGYSPTML